MSQAFYDSRYRRMCELRAQGVRLREIAALFGISHQRASQVLNDPDGRKVRERKLLYGHDCEGCGKRTNGSNGRGKAARLCSDCAKRRSKVWTREAVLEAIWTFASIHGRPPFAHEWQVAHSPAYPAAVSVYGRATSPFKKWSDAIEAAGFPRPRPGRRHPVRTV